MSEKEIAVIVGTGSGLSASLARRFAGAGMDVALAARNTDKLEDLAEEIGAKTYACDASEAGDVEAVFAAVASDLGSRQADFVAQIVHQQQVVRYDIITFDAIDGEGKDGFHGKSPLLEDHNSAILFGTQTI